MLGLAKQVRGPILILNSSPDLLIPDRRRVAKVHLSRKKGYAKVAEKPIPRHIKYLKNHTKEEDTVKKYVGCISQGGATNLWREFLKAKKVPIPHKDGLLHPESRSRLPYGQMSDLLDAFCQHILEEGFPKSAVETRLIAVIRLHRANGVPHEGLKALWEKARGYESTHKLKENRQSGRAAQNRSIPRSYEENSTDKHTNDLDNRAGREIALNPRLGPSRATVERYEGKINHWVEFLSTMKTTIPHKDGLLHPPSGSSQMHLPDGQMSNLLVAYYQHIQEKGLSMYTIKTRLNAVIRLHRVNGVHHECLTAMWRRVSEPHNTHGSKEKRWLTDKQLSNLDNRAWQDVSDPLEAAFRVVYECVREALYRPSYVTLRNLTDTNIRLRMEDVNFGHTEDKVQCLDMTIKEKTQGHPMVYTRLKKWLYNPNPKYKRRGLFNGMEIYLDLNPLNRTGPIAYPDGSPVTYARFKTKLRRWGSEAGIPFKVSPSVLRRSTIKSSAHRAPETYLRFQAHHLSKEVTKKHYSLSDKKEAADTRASLAVQKFGGTQSKDFSLKYQPKIFPHALFPRTLSFRFVLIIRDSV